MIHTNSEPAVFNAGFGEAVITPPLGTSLAGFFHDRVAKRIRDDLHARAIVVEDGSTRIAIVSLELICVDKAFVDKAKALIESETGIPANAIMIAATHTHTGPEVRMEGNKVGRNEEWLGQLPRKIADAVHHAATHTTRVTIRPGKTATDGYVFNRLYKLADGSEQMGTAAKGKKILGPAGEVDPLLHTLSFVDEAGTVRGIIFNISMHGGPTVAGGDADFISGDWPGEVARHLRRLYGDEVLPLFLQGSCGDTWPNPGIPTLLPKKGEAKAVSLGRGLAGAAAYAAERAEPATESHLASVVQEVEIPYYTRSPELLAEIAELKQRPELDAAQSYFISAVEAWPFDNKVCRVPLQAIRIADAVLVAIPAQIFTQIALEMKRWSPTPHTMIVELANSRVTSYVPTAAQVERGAYGSRPIVSRWLSTDTDRRLIDAVIVMLQELWQPE